MTHALNHALNHALPPRAQFLLGIKDQAPLMVGVMPFGLIFGALAVETGLTPLQIVAMSAITFGGAGQIVFLQLYASGANAFLISGTVSAVNIRHALYSASMAPYFAHLPWRWKIPLAYLLTDEAYAMSIRRFEMMPAQPARHYHLLGSGLLLWVMWQITTMLGIVVGAAIPPSLGLEFAIALTFMAILIPHLRLIPHLNACLTSGVVAVFAYPLPWKLSLICAGLAGMLVGFLSEKYHAKRGK